VTKCLCAFFVRRFTHYEGINRCNQALNIVPQLDKATPALRTRLVGEAKFLRAFYISTLKRLAEYL
jgi:hypothetical protein